MSPRFEKSQLAKKHGPSRCSSSKCMTSAIFQNHLFHQAIILLSRMSFWPVVHCFTVFSTEGCHLKMGPSQTDSNLTQNNINFGVPAAIFGALRILTPQKCPIHPLRFSGLKPSIGGSQHGKTQPPRLGRPQAHHVGGRFSEVDGVTNNKTPDGSNLKQIVWRV